MDLVLHFVLSNVVNQHIIPHLDLEDLSVRKNLYLTYFCILIVVTLGYVYVYTQISKQDKDEKSIRVEHHQQLSMSAMMAMVKYAVQPFFQLSFVFVHV